MAAIVKDAKKFDIKKVKQGIDLAAKGTARLENAMETIKSNDKETLTKGTTEVLGMAAGKIAEKVAGEAVPGVGSVFESQKVRDMVGNVVDVAKGDAKLRDFAESGHTVDAITKGISEVGGEALGVYVNGVTYGIVNSDYIAEKVAKPVDRTMQSPMSQITQPLKVAVQAAKDVTQLQDIGSLTSKETRALLVGDNAALDKSWQFIPKIVYGAVDKVVKPNIPEKWAERLDASSKSTQFRNKVFDYIEKGIDKADAGLYKVFGEKTHDMYAKASDRVADCVGQLWQKSMDGISAKDASTELSMG